MVLCVIRTNNLKNFACDLSFPSFFNCALKTSKLAAKIVFGVGFLFLDIITLPLRLITLLPRLVVSILQSKEKNPVYKFLLEKSTKPNIYSEVDTVYCHIYRKENGGSRSWSNVPFNFTPVPKPVICGNFSLI